MAKSIIRLRFKGKKKFDLALDAFVEKEMPAQHLKVQKKVAIDLFARIIDKTPVGNPDLWKESSLPAPPGYVGGRARGNWQITTTSPGSKPIEAIDPDGSVTQTVGLGKLSTAKPGGSIWIFNNVRYIKRLEDGWSTKQAPAGMVAVSLAEIEAGLS
jgi:hypothetical protein